MALAKGIKVVWKKVRDLTATMAVLVVMFGMLMAINPRVRERFSELTMSVQGGRDVNSSISPVSNAAYAAVSIGTDYASGNPFLFSFLVVAVILFMLMLRS
jgi:ribose/xylose/arabinose/galactoside ABC-type transport system permease subunit